MYSRICDIVFCVALMHTGDRGYDLAWRAVAALERIVIDESLLHGMQRAVRLCQTLDGRDIPALAHYREAETGKDAAIVHEHGACAALAVIAALLGSR